jgi:hypothetical protein
VSPCPDRRTHRTRRAGCLLAIALLAIVVPSSAASAAPDPGATTKLQSHTTGMFPPNQIPFDPALAGKTTISDNDPTSAGKLVRIIWTCGGVVAQDVTVSLQPLFPGALMSTGSVSYPAGWGAALPSISCTLTAISPVSFGTATFSFAYSSYWSSSMHIRYF